MDSSQQSTTDLLTAALEFAEKGWPVFPVRPRSKNPLTRNGLKDATTDPNIICDWWNRWPNANIGVPTENSLVVDIDSAKGENSLRALEEEFGPLPRTLQSSTGEGRHLWFAPNGTAIRNSAGKLGEGIDVRGIGGYVVAPPSIHESGKRYEWVSGDAPLAALPQWIAKKLADPSPNGSRPSGSEKIPHGQHNTELTRIAGKLRRDGLEENAITTALIEICEKRCEGYGADYKEMCRKIAKSVCRYAPGPGGTASAKQETADLASGAIAPRFSEEALALTFSARHTDDLRYVAGWGRWLRWDGTHWRHDDTLKVFDLARHICRETAAGVKNSALAAKIAAAHTVAAVERLARADRRHAATIEQWDSDPWLLNTPTGTVDLRTGEQREHRRNDCITKCTGAGLAGKSEDCPLWLNFLDRVTGRCVDL